MARKVGTQEMGPCWMVQIDILLFLYVIYEQIFYKSGARFSFFKLMFYILLISPFGEWFGNQMTGTLGGFRL